MYDSGCRYADGHSRVRSPGEIFAINGPTTGRLLAEGYSGEDILEGICPVLGSIYDAYVPRSRYQKLEGTIVSLNASARVLQHVLMWWQVQSSHIPLTLLRHFLCHSHTSRVSRTFLTQFSRISLTFADVVAEPEFRGGATFSHV